ncbi:uncharacterized protein LOC115887810 [Sitophilus oryzae]|uniref:Uncharacterized protein LOC115887810 n=1 Tax=Sitophilus oryzae TaxID=7048 RepID=A0A6J2YJY5_SITOR|nr:uncharacterized protein LOC115887810 [Sitophilus oryzae]
MNEKTAKELVKARKAVKRKYRQLKSESVKSESRRYEEFKPITEPLRELIKNIKSEASATGIKKEKGEEDEEKGAGKNNDYDQSFLISKNRPRDTNIYRKYLPPQQQISNLSGYDYDEDVFFTNYNNAPTQSDPHDETFQEPSLADIQQNILELTKSESYEQYLASFDPLVRSFVDMSIKSERELDHTHGLVHDIDTEKWKIGNSVVDFVGPDIKVNNIRYEGTPGLYELLFFKEPLEYKSQDLENYMDILNRTNAYRRNHDANNQIQGTSDSKYLTIIKPYLVKKGIIKERTASEPSMTSRFNKPLPPALQRPKTRQQSSVRKKVGAGRLKKDIPYMLNFSKKKTDYVYYDDINELVERLKLLISSQMAGHSGHNNEIISILEELREANIIE